MGRLTKYINGNRRKYKVITNADLYPSDYVVDDICIKLDEAIDKLGKLEDIEEELGIDLIALFSKQHEDSYDLRVEEEKKTIYFCGDSYYGHWNREEWLNFIKDVIAVYKELLKLEH